jgi:hypothetical protein
MIIKLLMKNIRLRESLYTFQRIFQDMRRSNYLLYFLALLKLVLPFFLQNGVWEPHRDEFLYLAEGRHLAWGFMEVPPLLSVFAWLTQAFGGGMFWIKIWPSLFGALTFLLTGKIILSLGGKGFALFLAWLPFIFGAYLRMNYLFQPNFLEVFFWTGMAYGLIRYQQTKFTRFLYQAGISFGLGMMSKYSVAFYAIGLMSGIILTWDKKILTNRHFYIAMGLGLLIFLPNFIWQWSRGFPVIFHMRELERTQLQYVSQKDFLVDQLMYNICAAAVWIAGLIWIAFFREGKSYRFIAWAYVVTIALLALAHAKSYYSMGAYPVLFAFGAYAIEKGTRKGYSRIWRYVLVINALLIGYAAVLIGLPILPPQALEDYYARTGTAKKVGALHWEDLKDHPLPQDFSDMQGWKEMTEKTAKVYHSLDSTERAHTMIFADNYGQAASVAYYGPRYGLPEDYSTEASFLYWIPDSIARMDNIEAFILITDDRQEMEHPFVHEFQFAQIMDSITNPYAREKGDYIILFKGPSDTLRKLFQEKVQHYKERSTAKGANGDSPIGALLHQLQLIGGLDQAHRIAGV